METKAKSGMMLALLLISTLMLAFNIQQVRASGTIYIRADGSIDPPTAAVQRNGNLYTFTDNIYGYSIVVERDNAVIDGDGYTLQGAEAYESNGMDLTGRENVTVRNIQITNFGIGIIGSSSNDNSMFRNNITNNDYGIRLASSLGNNISGNDITNNDYIGIWLDYYSLNNNISGNTITNNEMLLMWGCSGNVVHGNTMTNSIISLYDVDCEHNSIYGNRITNSGDAINLHGLNNTIYGNIITTDYGDGILLYSGKGGQHFARASYNSIWGNIITTKGGVGIEFWGSSYNYVYRNNLTAVNGDALHFHRSTFFPGGLMDSFDNNLFENNVVATNQYCVRLDNSSSGNLLYHNNFWGMHYVYSEGSANVWDDGYPSGGNYWSDYAGVDLNKGADQDIQGSDGIGDTPYVIDANNRDRYPLMNPWSPIPPIVTATVEIDPDTLNIGSKGDWITAYVQLPEEYSAADIDASAILLNRTIAPVLDPQYSFVTNSSEYLVDYDNNGIIERMVKFDRASFESLAISRVISNGSAALTITGKLLDGTQFEGTDIILVFYGGPGGRRK